MPIDTKLVHLYGRLDSAKQLLMLTDDFNRAPRGIIDRFIRDFG
ncbi:MAG: hypothetical protein RLO48_03900 [Bauldia litoralis]